MNTKVEPLVSIIIPSYNAAEHLPQCISDIKNQTWKNLEIIFVDDGSSDNTAQIIEEFEKEDPRIILVKLEKNSGVNKALASGLERSTANWLCPATSDDRILPDFIKDAMMILIKHPQAAYAFSDPAEWYPEKDEVNIIPLYLSDKPIYLSPQKWAELYSIHPFHMPTNTMIYRREAFMSCGGLIPELHTLADWFMTVALCIRYGVCYVPGCYTHKREHDDSYMQKNIGRKKRHSVLIRRLYKKMDKEFNDVAPLFIRSGIFPDYRLSMLFIFLKKRENWKWISLKTLKWTISRFLWRNLRMMMPQEVRRIVRKNHAKGKKTSVMESHTSL